MSLNNVVEDVRNDVASDQIALELANALDGIFSITYYKRMAYLRGSYTVVYCKPTKAISSALMVDREIIAVIANFRDIQQRTLQIIRDQIHRSQGRLFPSLAFVVHADSVGDEKLRIWGRENGIKVIPIYRSYRGSVPPTEVLRRNLAHELFSADPFQVTGPVVKDADFFGRGNEAVDILRHLEGGRIKSLFGIRKSGKTSLVNRIIKLAKQHNSVSIAMVDCSINDFNSLDAAQALRALAKVAKVASVRDYAHIADAIKKPDKELIPVFDDLWENNCRPLAIIFDEVDYITPHSPTAPHWRSEFNHFWRELRAVLQEAQRHGMTMSVLVAGVSTKPFRLEHIDGIENSALHLIPEEYITPFHRKASTSMVRDLEKRCGIQLHPDARDLLAETCGDFPFWMRAAGSHIHRVTDIDARPIELDVATVETLLDDFVRGEGGDIARVALENLQRNDPEVIELLIECRERGSLDSGKGRLLHRYGLVKYTASDEVIISSAMVRHGLDLLLANDTSQTTPVYDVVPRGLPYANIDEWAEELAIINNRRNKLERKLRELIRAALRLSDAGKSRGWMKLVLEALHERRRNDFQGRTGDQLLDGLYWLEIKSIISKNWTAFQAVFGDKKKFEDTMDGINFRPDAHAKSVDAADLALQRNYLDWLEKKLE